MYIMKFQKKNQNGEIHIHEQKFFDYSENAFADVCDKKIFADVLTTEE